MDKYFKLEKGSASYDLIEDLMERMKEANREAIALAKELGAIKGEVLIGWFCVCGRIRGFRMESQPDGWKKVKTQLGSFYFPKAIKANQSLLDRIAALPAITEKEFATVVNWNGYGHPGIEKRHDVFLVTADKSYTPMDGMVEITGSEFLALQNRDKDGQVH